MAVRWRCGRFSFVFLILSTFVLSVAEPPSGSEAHAGAVDPPSLGAPFEAQTIQLTGSLEILHKDLYGGKDENHYTIIDAQGLRSEIIFEKNPPTNFLTGDWVRVTGRKVKSNLLEAADGALLQSAKAKPKPAASPTPSPSVLSNTLGVQQTIVILVNFQDDAVQPYSPATASNQFFGIGDTLNSFMLENSYGQTSFTGTVTQWFTIPESVSTCNTTNIASDAQAAAAKAGYNLSNYSRYVYAFPQDVNCSFSGASLIGGNPSQSWINGTDNGLNPGMLDTSILDHELGHALGLWHSHLEDCGSSAIVCPSPNIIEYGDILDVMGPYQGGMHWHYNAFQKERLGWLGSGSSPPITIVTTPGTYSIYTYEVANNLPHALKLYQSTDSSGNKTWYYVESRQAIGFDAPLTNGSCESCYTQNATTGVTLHLGTTSEGNSSDLLDMTPATPTQSFWYDFSLEMGFSYADPITNLGFSVNSVTPTVATVTITN